MATQSILESAASRAQENDGADLQTGKAMTKIIPTARFKKTPGIRRSAPWLPTDFPPFL